MLPPKCGRPRFAAVGAAAFGHHEEWAGLRAARSALLHIGGRMSRSGRFRAACVAVLAGGVVVVEACGSGTASSIFHGGETDGSVSDTSPPDDTGGGHLLGD